jgi:lipopolysaccharide/colanic/teichoic acid biosynthesis glycosyltransferase
MNKRLFDITVASFGLLIFAVPIVAVAIAIVVDDGFPVLFRQKRLGINLTAIEVYKFRTMRDEKVTRVGKWLRATGLDEVLQFINVLRGSMSIVGPRPLTRQDLERLNEPGFMHTRLHAKPGITGLAQLFAGKGARVSLYLERKYLLNQSLCLDIRIVLLSFLVNLLGKRRVRLLLGK